MDAVAGGHQRKLHRVGETAFGPPAQRQRPGQRWRHGAHHRVQRRVH